MPMNDLTLMVMPDQRVWIDSDSIITYLRAVQCQARNHASAAYSGGESYNYAGAMAVHQIIEQIADSIVLTGIEARDRIKGSSVSE